MMKVMSARTGRAVTTLTGYKAFIPNPLPPEPPIQIDAKMQYYLSMADQKLGRLDGITRVIPNPDLFLAMYVKKEAVLSSQIEGTQASLVDVLETPETESGYSADKQRDIEDVVNYVHAMNYGLQRVEELPLSLRLIREIHKILLQGVRGSERHPGEFRSSQNWIGPAGCNLSNAVFVPPPVEEMKAAMADLESYFYDSRFMPPLIKIALIHAQFETIHPFLDGNGRMGRLLITFWLCYEKILSKPLLYLSYYFKKNRNEYYDRLMDVRLQGEWEKWIIFFLEGIAVASDEAIETATLILALKKRIEEQVAQMPGNNLFFQKLLDFLFKDPIITRKKVVDLLGIASPTAKSTIEAFCSANILRDITPERQRNKVYHFGEYLDLLNKDT